MENVTSDGSYTAIHRRKSNIIYSSTARKLRYNFETVVDWKIYTRYFRKVTLKYLNHKV